MNPDNFEGNLPKIIEIMEFLRTHKLNEDSLPPELQELFKRIEEQIDVLQQANDAMAKNNDVDVKNLRLAIMTSPDIPAKEKRDLQRAKRVERDIASYQTALEEVQKKVAKPKHHKGQLNDEAKLKSKERKKRFKPLGSDKGWIPM